VSRILAYVPDLMDRSRLAGIQGVELVARATDLASQAAAGDTVVVDLSRPGVLEVVPLVVAAGARVVGFISHVDSEGTAAARAAGCDPVLARSVFFSRLPALLAELGP